MSRRVLAWNSVSGMGIYALSGGVSFLMAPFLVHHLTNQGYGFWELLMGMAGYLGILDLGISPAVMRYVALARGEGNQARLLQVVNTGFLAFLVAGVCGAALMGLAAIKPSILFGALPLPLSEGRLLVGVGALLLLVSFVRTTFTAALLGLQLHRLLNLIRSLSTTLQAGTVFWVLCHDDTHALLKLALITLGTSTLESLAAALLLRRVLKARLSPRHARWSDAKELMGFGVKSTGIMAASSLMRQGMLFVISHGLGPAAVTFYVLATRLIDYGSSLSTAVGYPITPHLAQALGKDGIKGAAQAYEFTTRAMTFICAGIAMGVWWLGLPFLARWMGPEYAQQGGAAFHILAAGLFVQLLGVNSSRMLFGLNKHGQVAVWGGVLAIVSFSAALLTVPKLGLPAAAGTLALYGAGMNLWELWLVSRALNFSFVKHILTSLKQILGPLAAGSAILALLRLYWPATEYWRFPVHALAGGLAYTAISLLTMLGPLERRRLIGFVRGAAATIALRRKINSAPS